MTVIAFYKIIQPFIRYGLDSASQKSIFIFRNPASTKIFVNTNSFCMKPVSFRESHSAAIRFWHWTSFIVVGLQLMTIFVGKTFLNFRYTATTIQQTLEQKHIQISNDQSADIAFALRSRIWEWHTVIGYILCGLLAFRILIEFLQPREQQFFARMRRAFFFYQHKEDQSANRHYLIVKSIYLVFYLMIFTMAGTGLWMASNLDQQFVKGSDFIFVKKIHENFMFLILLFIFIHLAGVISAERKKYKGVVSDMIHGGK